MSKWTLQKILDCDEIEEGTKFGTRFDDVYMVLYKSVEGLLFWSNTCNTTGTYDVIDSYISFYRPDGTEILPPKDKVKRIAQLLMAKKDQTNDFDAYDVIKGQLVVAQGEEWDTDLWQEVKVLPCGKIEVEEE